MTSGRPTNAQGECRLCLRLEQNSNMALANQALFEAGAAFVHPVPANDDQLLDNLLADLPTSFPDIPAPAVVNLDGTPAAPGPTYQDRLAAVRAARRARWDAIKHPADDGGDGDVIELEIPARTAPRLVPCLVTNAPRRRRRRSHLRQREDARKMRAHGRALEGEPVEHPSTSLPAPTTHHKRTPIPTIKSTTTKRKRGLASWEEAGELPRIIAANRALPIFGQPFAFSLNLGPDVIKAANDNARGFLDHVRRRVALNLKRELGRTVALWIVVETDDDGRPHLHGGLALADNDRPVLVEEALAKAGGNWTRRGSRPADCRVQWEPDGWAVYPLKRLARTRRHLRDAAGLPPGARTSIYSVTADLLAEGKRIHEDVRRSIGRS